MCRRSRFLGHPLERAAEGIAALGGSYQIDGHDAIKIALAPNGATS
jgi:hypothetical protein